MDLTNKISGIPDELLNMRAYPEIMFMDMYGNGSQSWDRPEHRNLLDVIFRVKYIRADLSFDLVQEARQQGLEAAKTEIEYAKQWEEWYWKAERQKDDLLEQIERIHKALGGE